MSYYNEVYKTFITSLNFKPCGVEGPLKRDKKNVRAEKKIIGKNRKEKVRDKSKNVTKNLAVK